MIYDFFTVLVLLTHCAFNIQDCTKVCSETKSTGSERVNSFKEKLDELWKEDRINRSAHRG